MFIMQQIIREKGVVENEIVQGTKIMSLTTGRITLKDSLFFRYASLSLPKNVWYHRTAERVFSASLQHPGE